MIGVIVWIYTIQPPTKRKAIEHILAVVYTSPGIAWNAAGVTILRWKYGSNREINKEIITTRFGKVTHAIVVGLYAGGNVRIIKLIGFQCCVVDKVYFYVLIAPVFETFYLPVYTGQRTGMRGIKCIRFYFATLAVGSNDDIAIFVFTVCSFHVPVIFFASPKGEGRPVNTRDLPVGFAMGYEVFELLFIKVIPKGVEYHIYLSVFIMKSGWLQFVSEIIWDINSTGIIHFIGHTSPTLPGKNGPFLPR